MTQSNDPNGAPPPDVPTPTDEPTLARPASEQAAANDSTEQAPASGRSTEQAPAPLETIPVAIAIELPSSAGPALLTATPDDEAKATVAWVVGRLRASAARRHLLAAALAGAGAAAVLALLFGAALGLGAPAFVRHGFPLLALGLTAAAIALAVRHSLAAPAELLARRLEAVAPEAAGLSTAVALSRQLAEVEELPPGERPFSPSLAAAHVRAVSHAALGAELHLAVDPRPLRWAAIALPIALVALGLSAKLSDRVSRGLVRLSAGDPATTQAATKAAARHPITSEVQLTYVYPAYTGLPQRVVEGTTGEIAAPRGTEVRLQTRSDRAVARALIEVDGASLPLQVEGGRALSGSLTVQKSGPYRFRFEDATGAVLATGPDVPIHAVEDGPPEVRVTAPVPELVVSERDTVEVKYDATDDFGLGKLELVYRVGAADEARLTIVAPPATPRRIEGAFPFELTPLGLQPGDVVTYSLRATDNDGLAGGKQGSSRPQTLKVFSAADHRRELLARLEQLWEGMVVGLGERITPREGPGKVELEQRVGAGKPADELVLKLTTELATFSRELAKDELAPAELTAATANVAAGLEPLAKATRTARQAAGQRGPADRTALARLDGAEFSEQRELEKDVLYLEALLDRRRMEELKELAGKLSEGRRELARLADELGKAPSDEAKRQLQQEVARLKSRLAEIMKQMAELGSRIQDEHLNEEAMKQLDEQKDLMSELDEIQKLLAEGKTDEALKKLQELGMQLDELEKGLQEAQDSQLEEDPEMRELAQKMKEFEQELGDLKRDQEELASRTEEEKRAYQKQIEQELKKRGEDLIDELRRKTEAARVELAEVPPDVIATGRNNELEGARERLSDLEHALSAKDFEAAREAAHRAEQLTEDVREAAAASARSARWFDGGDPRRAEEATRRASNAADKTSEVKETLDKMMPNPDRNMTPEQRGKMEKLARRQGELEKRMQGLRQKSEELGSKAPIFDEKAKETMRGAQGSMAEAKGKLEGKDPGGGLASERRAGEQLAELERGLEEAKKSGGGGKGGKGGTGFPMPMAMRGGRGERDGTDGSMNPDQKVLIPGADQYQAPEEYRRDILEAMKNGTPAAFEEHVRGYYEEIVK